MLLSVFVATRPLLHHVSSLSAFPAKSRREWMTSSAVACTTAVGWAMFPLSSPAVVESSGGELPSILKDYTRLAPLGPSSFSSSSLPKTYGLTLDALASRLTKDLTQGAHGNDSYIISGDISTDLFRDDCTFQDPTNRVKSLGQYKRVLEILFDPAQSTVELLEPLSVDTSQRTISGTFRSQGVLQLPWKPYVSPYESQITYRVDDAGLVYVRTGTNVE